MESRTHSNGPSEGEASLGGVERCEARYLYAIATEAGRRDGRVSNGALREAVGVTPASASEMASKLGDRGLVDHEKYRGVRLTDRGEALAARVAWRVCVLSAFFESTLETALDEERTFDVAVSLPADGLSTLSDRVETSCLALCPESAASIDTCVTR